MQTVLVKCLLYVNNIVLIAESKEKLLKALVEWEAELLHKGMSKTYQKQIPFLSWNEE